MSESEDETNWCIFGSNVPPPSPSKARVLSVISGRELKSRRLNFWSAHEMLSVPNQPESPRPESLRPESRTGSETVRPIIQPTHPGPPHPCNTQRDPAFDSVSFVLSCCQADPKLGVRFAQTDRKQFLSVLHRGFSLERWHREERLALAGHLLLLCALAQDEPTAQACARQLRSERCCMRQIVRVAIVWGAALEDLQPPQDLLLPDVTPSRPPSWCVTHTLRALPSLLHDAARPETARANLVVGTGSPSSESAASEPSAAYSGAADQKLDDVALAARALALCALDSAQPAEFVPALASVVAAAQPWTPHAILLLSDSLHFPTAHAHSQAWLLSHLVRAQPLRTHLAQRQLHSLLADKEGVGWPMESLEANGQPMAVLETNGLPIEALETKYVQPVAALENDGKPASALETNGQTMDALETNEQGKEELEANELPMAHVEVVDLPMASLQVSDEPVAGLEQMEQATTSMDGVHKPMTDLQALDEPLTCGDLGTSEAECDVPTAGPIANPVSRVEAMDESERPCSRASTVGAGPDSPLADSSDRVVPLARLLRLLTQRRQRVDSLGTYDKFVFLIVLAACVGDAALDSNKDKTELRLLICWLSELLMSLPIGTSQLDAVLIQSVVASTTSLWRRTLERSDLLESSLSQLSQSQGSCL